MVDPKCECTPSSFSSLGCRLISFKNQSKWLLRMPNLELAKPVETYECTYSAFKLDISRKRFRHCIQPLNCSMSSKMMSLHCHMHPASKKMAR